VREGHRRKPAAVWVDRFRTKRTVTIFILKAQKGRVIALSLVTEKERDYAGRRLVNLDGMKVGHVDWLTGDYLWSRGPITCCTKLSRWHVRVLRAGTPQYQVQDEVSGDGPQAWTSEWQTGRARVCSIARRFGAWRNGPLTEAALLATRCRRICCWRCCARRSPKLADKS